MQANSIEFALQESIAAGHMSKLEFGQGSRYEQRFSRCSSSGESLLQILPRHEKEAAKTLDPRLFLLMNALFAAGLHGMQPMRLSRFLSECQSPPPSSSAPANRKATLKLIVIHE